MPFRCDLTVMYDSSALLDRLPRTPHLGVLDLASSDVDSAQAPAPLFCPLSFLSNRGGRRWRCGRSPTKPVWACHQSMHSSWDEDDAVGEGGAGLDEAMRDVLRPVGPRVPLLVLAVAAR